MDLFKETRDDDIVLNPKPFGPTHTMWFGKYRGQTIQEVLDKDPEYLQWAINTIKVFIKIGVEPEVWGRIKTLIEFNNSPAIGQKRSGYLDRDSTGYDKKSQKAWVSRPGRGI